jgi:tRNA (guanosine-2'-O-)-methyltransferase
MEGTTTPSALRGSDALAIVFGNEHRGVSEALRALSDGTYAIPMNGFVESLNVSVAAAITMHAATEGRAGDLTAHDQQALRARFMLNSVRNGEVIVHEVMSRQDLRAIR